MFIGTPYESNTFWVLRIDEKQYHLQEKLTFTFTFWDKRIDEKYLHLHLGIRGLMRKADIYICILESEDWWEKVTFTDSEGIAHCKDARLTEWGFSISQSVRLAFLSRRPKALSSVIWKLIAAQAPNGPFLLQVLHFLISLNKFVIYTSEMRVSAICNGYWRSSKSKVDYIITPSSKASIKGLHHSGQLTPQKQKNCN